MIDYERMKRNGPKHKAALTRASRKPLNERYAAVLKACKAAVQDWNEIGAWPDNWHLWQRTLDNAAIAQHIQTIRLEDL